MAMQIESRDESGGRVLQVVGEVDMDSSPRLRDEISKSLKARGAASLKVRLQDVDYVDSSGIAVLIQGMKDAGKAGVAFALLDPSTNVRSVIELAMLQEVFTIEETSD